LKSANFFDVDQFPNVSFKSLKVTKTDADSLDIVGDRTTHGITQSVTLHARINKIGENTFIHSQTAGFDANTVLKRSDFDLSMYVPMIGD